jgi:hypothetical protein
MQVPPRLQLDADSSAGSEGGDVNCKVDATGAAAAASWLPPLKKGKQKRKATGQGWFDCSGGVEVAALAADPGGGHGASQTEVDDFGWESVQSTFQKRKPRNVGGLGTRTGAIAAVSSTSKVNTHFLAGTGVSDA